MDFQTEGCWFDLVHRWPNGLLDHRDSVKQSNKQNKRDHYCIEELVSCGMVENGYFVQNLLGEFALRWPETVAEWFWIDKHQLCTSNESNKKIKEKSRDLLNVLKPVNVICWNQK